MTKNANPAGNPIVTVVREITGPEPSGEFEAFETLTDRLVQVPKSEIDEQRAAS